ncbi:MAG: hypothetical protein KKF78_10505, partial [Candidatus Omnitrophica bacterium]|nr:hypothetical protein [Candidatus Omnitrophota bacterium]MBU1997572.1 hypothetical protein [Candidatus Omnitrophota bacterium]
MKNNRILFILVYSCIFLLFCFENPAYSKDKVDLTIYSNGKKFGSLHDYKLTMLKQKILDSIPLGKEDQFEGFLNNFSNILSNETSKEYSESDLKLLFQEIY